MHKSSSRSKLTRSIAVGVCAATMLASCSGGDDAVSDAESSAGVESATVSSTESTVATDAADLAPAPPIVDGLITDAALAGLISGDTVDPAALDALLAEIESLPEAERLVIGNDLAMRVELAVAALTGLEQEAGGREALETALRGAFAAIATEVDASVVAASELQVSPPATSVPGTTAPSGFRSASGRRRALQGLTTFQDSGPSISTVGSFGVMMGSMSLGMLSDFVTDFGSSAKPGAPPETKTMATDSTVTASLDSGAMSINHTGTQDGVAVQFKAEAETHPCPKADGSFDIKLTIDVKVAKGGGGQVDDNADVAGYDTTTNTKWTDSGAEGTGGSVIDFTTTSGQQGGVSKPGTYTTNTSAGSVDPSTQAMATLMSTLIAYDTIVRYVESARKAWQSGRCVQLDLSASAGPSGLEPSEQVTITAKPTSKIDGSPTGGNVTAMLSAGGATVEPMSTPVPADAEFTYTAPDERDKSGTVSAESRSKRGVGKASITLDTKQLSAYMVVGGLEDFQVSQAVCDITGPFTLDGGIGTAVFSGGGLSGSYTATGVFNFSYAGTYVIELTDGLGSPGTMVATSGGQIAGEAGSGSEVYSLTPLETCP